MATARSLLSATGHHRGLLHSALAVPLTDLGEDAVDVSGLRSGLSVYCGYDGGAPGYRNGSYTNMSAIKAAFPGKRYISVGYDAIDIEPGLASPADAPGFVQNWKKVNTVRPLCYANASTMPDVISELNGAGISRSRYFLWDAEWDDDPSIPSNMDGKQYQNTSGFDADSFYEYLWEPVVPPVANTFKAPTGLKAHREGTAGKLTWKAVADLPGHPVTGYHVVVYDLPPVLKNGHWTVVRQVSTSSPVLEATVFGLEIGKPYQVHVWALGSPVSSDKNFASVNFGPG